MERKHLYSKATEIVMVQGQDMVWNKSMYQFKNRRWRRVVSAKVALATLSLRKRGLRETSGLSQRHC
jgi:hypothetical protein